MEQDLAAAGDPLASLGLIDPKSGTALATEDWRPGSSPAAPVEQSVEEARAARTAAEEGTGAGQSPAGQEPQAGPADGSQGSAPAWDSDQNPYKQQAQQLQQQISQTQLTPAQAFQQVSQQIDMEAQGAYQQLVTVGLDPTNPSPLPSQVAQMVVNSARNAALADATLARDRAMLFPAAKAESARRVAEEFSVGNVKIEEKELASEPTIEAMRARARTLQEVRRDGSYKARQAAGTDRAESPGGLSKIDYDKLSSRDKIRLGIRRGQA